MREGSFDRPGFFFKEGNQLCIGFLAHIRQNPLLEQQHGCKHVVGERIPVLGKHDGLALAVRFVATHLGKTFFDKAFHDVVDRLLGHLVGIAYLALRDPVSEQESVEHLRDVGVEPHELFGLGVDPVYLADGPPHADDKLLAALLCFVVVHVASFAF